MDEFCVIELPEKYLKDSRPNYYNKNCLTKMSSVRDVWGKKIRYRQHKVILLILCDFNPTYPTCVLLVYYLIHPTIIEGRRLPN